MPPSPSIANAANRFGFHAESHRDSFDHFARSPSVPNLYHLGFRQLGFRMILSSAIPVPRPQYIDRVKSLFAIGCEFQIGGTIVVFVSVLVIDCRAVHYRTIEMMPDKSMTRCIYPLAVPHDPDLEVVSRRTHLCPHLVARCCSRAACPTVKCPFLHSPYLTKAINLQFSG